MMKKTWPFGQHTVERGGCVVDVWMGEVNFTVLVLVVSVAVLFPVQLLLCFKVRSLGLRLLPAVACAVLAVAMLVMAAATPGWDGIGYVFLATYGGFLLFACGVGWGIWALVNRQGGKRPRT